jgi:hypothetical protein
MDSPESKSIAIPIRSSHARHCQAVWRMSGDWMKVELDLPDKPEVFRIASILSLDPDSVVGKLVRVWSWFDKHTEDGNAHSVTFALVDRITGVTGFAEAMTFAGWLEQEGSILRIPKFERHNGKTAKNRALTAKRVASHKVKTNADGNDKGNAAIVSDALPREEKRREDIKEKNTRKRVVSIQTLLPPDFSISERVRKWATDKGHTKLEAHLEHFAGTARAKGYKYTDWDEAFMNAIRSNWAQVGGNSRSPSSEPPTNYWKAGEM